MKKVTLLIGIILLAVSCNKLDLKPLDRLSETDTWTDASLIRLYVNATYTSVMMHGFQQDLLAAACDEGFNIHDYGSLQVVQRGNLTADNVSSLSTKINYFNYAYSNIRDINTFFSKIGKAPVDDAFKDGTTGEMKFLRAYLYANLIWRYGSVPLITKVFDLHDDFKVSMTSYDDCVKFIVQELDDASLLLPADQSGAQGQASGNACKALKSRVLLYAASQLNNPEHSKAKWQAAADAAAALLNAGYQLNPDYQGTFLTANKEIIFARYFTQTNNTNFNLVQGRNGSDGYGAENPSQNMVNAYEMAATGKLPYIEQPDGTLTVDASSGYDPGNPYAGRDPRFDASILHDGSVWAGRVTETFHGGKDSPESANGFNASLTSYYYKKFLDESIPPSGSTVLPASPWIFFRYAEILLNYAEAEFELGNEDIARQYVNMVRARPGVNMPPVTDAGEKLRERIQNERRVELAFEGHRFFDVRRWKIAAQTENKPLEGMNIQKAADGTKTYAISKVIDRKFLDWQYNMPFPRAEIDKSQGVLIQNNGY
jgi:hypothetical protein